MIRRLARFTRFALVAVFALVCFLPVVSCTADAVDPWIGTYRYEFAVGTNSGAKVPIIYTLAVQRGGTATLKGEGYQTDDELICDTKTDGSTLRVLFRNYPNGGTKNQFDVELYKPGTALVTLARRGDRLITTWGAYNTDAPKPKDGAVQFQRVGAK